MRIKSLLAGIDFSDTAFAAIEWAAKSFAPEANLTLAHVMEVPHVPAFARYLTPASADVEAVARKNVEARMRNVVAQLSYGAPRCEIRVGKPDEEIVALADAVDADMVVIGPHGDRPRPSKFLGTTAERIVRTSPVPVLVAGSPPQGGPRNILVPVDDFSITPLVLEWTRDLANAFDAKVTLLHVWSNAIYSHVASMSHVTTHSEAEARADITKELHDSALHWLNELARTGMDEKRVSATVTYGNAGDAAVEMAAAMRADLIVLGRRGSGLVAPALLGSTVGTVLHGARCPVLVITETARRER
jgi:nucleotide-binding universal stress UspA family protein